MPKKKAPSERACARLARHERQAIERMLDRGQGCREVAREVGRAPSTPSSPAPGVFCQAEVNGNITRN